MAIDNGERTLWSKSEIGRGGDDDMKFENIIHRSIFHEYQAWPGDSYQSNDSNGLRLGVE